MPAGTHNIFEKVLSSMAPWRVGYSNAETAQPGMNSVQPTSSSKKSDAPAEAAPGVQRACQQACWRFIWHQAAVLEHSAGVSLTHLMLASRDQMTQALLQSGSPLCWHTLALFHKGHQDIPKPAERPVANTSSGLGQASSFAGSQTGQECCGSHILNLLANAGPPACSNWGLRSEGRGWREQQQQQWAACAAVAAAGAGAACHPAAGHAAATA